MGSDILLDVEQLSITYEVDPPVRAVKEASFSLKRGEILGLAGESGCGKTTLAYGIQRLLKPPAAITGGQAIFHDINGQDIQIEKLNTREMQAFRWDKISMVFQGAMNSLNPVLNIRTQLADIFTTHRPDMPKPKVYEECGRLLDLVGVGNDRLKSFPHELSGGMRQRVMIAMALALKPQLMVMDEPTTALDVLVQREILQEIASLQKQFGFSVIFITHDLPLLLEISDRIAVMKDGEIVELSEASKLYHNAEHPYTRRLLQSFPSLTGERGDFVRKGATK